MPETEIKQILKCKYFGFRRSSHDFFESCLKPPDWQVYAADFIASLEMNYMTDENFWICYRVYKNREKVFPVRIKKFYSCIDAMVLYQDWTNRVRELIIRNSNVK